MPLAALALLFGLTATPVTGERVPAITPAIEDVPDADITGAQAPHQDTGQDAAAGKTPPPHSGIRVFLNSVGSDVKHLPSLENGYLALVGAALALGAHQVDHTFNAHVQSHNTFVNGVFAPAKYYGDTPEQAALSLGAYWFGRIFDKPKVSHLASDLVRAQIVTEALVQPLKFSVRRERPDGSNRQSFPSGHAGVTFAAAAVLERHLGWTRAALAYAIATYVVASRLHDNVHYLSDVTFGAAVGTIAGRTVTRHGRDAWTFIPVSVPGGGVAIYAMRAER